MLCWNLYFLQNRNQSTRDTLENCSFSSYFCILKRIYWAVRPNVSPLLLMKQFIPLKPLHTTFLRISFLTILMALVGGTSFAVVKTSIGTTWAVAGNWSPSGIPVAGDDIIINTNMTTGPGTALSYNSFTVNSGFSFNHTGTSITVSGNLLVDGSYQLTTLGLTVNGTTTINGSINDNSTTGANIFVGLVTIGPSGSFTNTGNPTFEFRGGITNNGTFTITGTGVSTFSTNASQTIQGNALTFGPVTIGTGVTLQSSGSVPVTINGNLIATGNIDFTGAGLTTLNSGTLSGAGNVTLQSLSATSLTVSQTGTLTVLGATSTNTAFAVSATSGLKRFDGLVTISSGTFSSSNVAPFEFRNGISNSGTLTLNNTSNKTFSTNNQALSGAGTYAINTIVVNNITLTNNSGLTVTGSMDGPGAPSSFVQGTSSTLTYSGAGSIMGTAGCTFDPSASGNTVTYSGAAQNIRTAVSTYHHLVTSGSSTKTIFNPLTVTGNLTVGAGTTFQGSGAIANVSVYGLVTISGTNGVINLSASNPAIELRGGIVQNSNSTSNFGTGTVSFSLNNQIISGSGTGLLSFGGSVILNDGISLNNFKSVTISGSLDASFTGSIFTNANGSILNYAFAGPMFPTAGALVATAISNTVNYTGAAQTIYSTSYHNLGISGSGVKAIEDITVGGDLIHTAGTLSCGATSTQTFSGPTAGTLRLTTNSVLNSVLISKTGSSITLFGAAYNFTISNDFNLSSGSLIFGSFAHTLTLNGDMSGSGTLDLSGASTHILNLNGVNNSIGTFLSTTGVKVVYGRAGDQTLFGSPNVNELRLSGSGTKSLGGAISISDSLVFLSPAANSVVLSLGSNDLTLKNTAWLVSRSSAGGVSNNPFGLSPARYILTDGNGSFKKEGTTSAELLNFVKNGAGTRAPSTLIPIGTTGFYNPVTMGALTATVAGTGSISYRAVALKQSNVPYYNNALVKYWSISSSNLSAISSDLSFSFGAGEVIGSVTFYEPRVWNGSTLATVAGPSAPGSNPFSTTGTSFLTGEWTAIDPTIRNAYYSYISGDWNSASTWTTDPSGTTLINSAVPGVGDQVYILNGRNVTNALNNLTTASLTIENGASLDMGPTTGHNFGPVSGSGLYRQSTITLPTANFTQFVASTGGTFEYYNLPAGSNVLSSSLGTYNNLLVTNTSGTSFAVVQDHSITVNGSFNLNKTGAGTITYTLGNSATSWTLSIRGNATVSAGSTWNCGLFNAIHNVEVFGNLTNSGTILFTNAGTAYTNPTTGAANITFRGVLANTTFTSNAGSSGRFNGFNINKNNGYELFVTAAAGVSPQFWSNGSTLNPINGTLRLGNNITVPQLTNAGNYDLGTSGNIPTLWIDGATVSFNSGGAIVPYGTLKISAGTLNVTTGQMGIVLRETGQLIIEGGTVNAIMFRTSTTSTTHRGSYFQSGGTFNLNAAYGGGVINHYAIFALPYADNVFQMSGGTINITRNFLGGITQHGGIHIACTEGNYSVTGGNVNVNITPSASYNFDISSSAPLYNLTISRSAGTGGQVRLNSIPWSFDGAPANTLTYPAQPLVILNDFVINGANSPVFDALNSNVTVRGNFTIQNGGTYQSTAQTLIFDALSNQTFTVNGSLGTGLSSVTVNKSGSTLTIAGTVGTLSLRANLNLLAGTLADGGKTLNVAGNITNIATHTGAGKISLNGTSTSQTISGTSTGTFANLEFNNTNGAAGSTQITVTNNLQINGNLSLATDRVAFIGGRQILLSSGSSITGTFSANRHIKTNGVLSDGGIRKIFSSTAAFTFPLGYGTNYSPATVQFTSTPTTWGSLEVKPVGNKQLYVTDPDCFNLYWRVNTSGFTGVPANSINYTFGYGNLADNVSYIPAYYNFQDIAFYPNNDVNQVNEVNNTILFTGISNLDGDYTAGNPAAFGIVIPFYSRVSGNWNTPGTWSNVGFGGVAASSIPASNSPVLIGDGNLYNHTVTVTTNGTISGSLIVDAGSVLDCGVTTGNNFGAIPFATAGGAGKIRISSSTSTAEFPAGDFGLFFGPTGGTAEYYTTGGVDFTIPNSTASPTSISIDSYRNLVFAPDAASTISFPDKDLRIYEDLSVNGNAGGVANLAPATARTIRVDDDFDAISGILEIGSAVNQRLEVYDNFRIQSNGTVRTASTGSSTHAILVEGGVLTEGVLSLNNASKANLTLQGNTSEVWSGTNAGANISLSNLVVNKGTSSATELEVTTLGTFSAPSTTWLTLTNGTLKLSNAASLTLTNTAVDFIIPASAGLTLNNPGLTVNVGLVNSASADLVLNGKLSVLDGTLNIGNPANLQNNDLEYGSSGSPELTIAGSATLNITGQIRRSVNVQSGSLVYNQSGNSTVLVRGMNSDAASSLTYDRAKFEILNTGSQFNMSGNSLLIIDRRGLVSGLFGDVFINPASFSITGGTIQIGTSSTLAAQTFLTSSTAPLWNLTVNGTTQAKTVSLVGNPIQIQNTLRIEGNSVFNTNGLNVVIGGDLVNQNTSAVAGLTSGGYQPVNATQVTTFNSSAANQTISGVSGNLTNFGVLTLSNTFTGGQVQLASNSNVRVFGNLNIQSGQFNTGTNVATCLLNVVNNSGHTSSGSGSLVMGGSVLQLIQSSGTASFGSLRIANSAGVNTECNTSVSGVLNILNGILYINTNLLDLGVSASVSGSFSATNMIRTNGVTSDAGVRKAYPASASDFTFPIGVTLKYTPARFNVTANTAAGTITVKPVDIRHPATTDPANLELDYYWRVASTGFNGSTTVSHTYKYEPLDVQGTETNYVTGRFFGSIWAPTLGIPGTVNPATDEISLTGVNYFDGDFTAGEPTEFNILTTFYSRNATLGGNWDDPNSWSIDAVLQHAGAAAPTFPNFNQVVVASGHTINANGNNRNSVSLSLAGNLNLANSIGHNFGNVTGTGRIIQTATAGNQYIFPGGDYSAFNLSTGGTFEFGGTVNGTLSTQATYNNVVFTGTSTKSLPNANISLNGNLTISAGSVNNPSNRNIALAGNWTNSVGIAGFSPGAGLVSLTGSAQTLSGATNFNQLQANGSGIKTLGSSMTVGSQLILTSGIIATGANNLILSSGATSSGASAASYVNGNLQIFIPASATSVSWPVGDASRYAPVTVSFTGTTTAGGSILAYTTGFDHPQIYTSGVDGTKSANRYWTLTNSGVGGFTGYNITTQYDAADLDGSANPLNFILARYSASTWTQPTVGTITSTSVQGINIAGTVFGDFQAGQSINGKIWTGTTNTNWNVATNWIPVNPPNNTENAIIGNVVNQPNFLSGGNGFCKDLVLQTGANVTIPTGYTLNVGGNIDASGNAVTGTGILNITGASSTLTGSLQMGANLLVDAAGSLILGAGSNLQIEGNLTVNGTLNPGTSPVTFTGPSNSVVSGAGANFYNLVVNKNSSNEYLQLGSNISVSNQLDLQSGDVELNGFQLDMGSSGTLVNETVNNRVTGITGGSIRAVRNLNAPSSVNVGGLGAVISSGVNMGSTEVIRRHNQVVFGIGYGMNRRYEIHPTTNSGLNATLVVNYFDDELTTGSGTIVEGELDLWRYNGSTWDVQNATLNAAANTLTKTGIPQFSEWTGASEVNNPLGVEMAWMQVVCGGKSPVLKWRTLKETDTRSFEIQISEDGKRWERLGSVLAAGNSDGKNDYTFDLQNLASGFRQIRLVLDNMAGEKETFRSLWVDCADPVLSQKPVLVYPNPTEGAFTIEIPNGADELLDIRVLNVLGQEVAGKLHDGTRSSKIGMDLRGLSPGLYKIQIAGENSGPRTVPVTIVVR